MGSLKEKDDNVRRNYLEQFYSIDEKTGDYIIEISIEDYNDIFNSWDSSVYNVRDLDSSLKTFLEDCSYDIDLKNNIVMRFIMDNQKRNKETEKRIEKGIRSFFRYRLYVIKSSLFNKRKRAIIYIIISILFISLSYTLQVSTKMNLFNNIIFQGLSVGGWVFLWEAFSLLFIQHGNFNKKKKEYKRLLNSSMEFKYK
ncbi:hypothetical protein [Dethiothermospora halolimnae]|uniref:hypothetical protein n=1 Tax=Dethiothermospora halolimnae TaxID=3114390 RepID=UPI003CCC0749